MKENYIKSEISSWLDNAGRFPLLSQEDTFRLSRKIQSLPGDSIQRKKLVNKLVSHNLRLVTKFVKNFLDGNYHSKWGCPETVDYLQVGAMGLIRAAELYDPAKGYTFSTYADHWIRSKVSRFSLKNKSIVNISESTSRKIIFFNRNGYFKCRRTGVVYTSRESIPLIREAETAMNCTSLNIKNEFGFEIIDAIPGSPSNEEQVLCEEIHDALDAAGVSALGKEILFSVFVHENSCPEIAQRLNVNVHKIRREKKIAIELAKQSKELMELV